ncbi:MAG: hypothetical protein QXD84_10015, partial [Thermoplasmata archaeon]
GKACLRRRASMSELAEARRTVRSSRPKASEHERARRGAEALRASACRAGPSPRLYRPMARVRLLKPSDAIMES